MQAAQDAAQPPLLVRQVLDRVEGIGDSGVEEDVKIDATDHDHPEIEVAERAQVIHRIPATAEGPVKPALEPHEAEPERLSEYRQRKCL
ncbi:MAG: hypothetical protein HYY38_00325 [Rhodospirillales bacterium]|nr:hypothetical protein [Rhodospirillales bacterium]